jgi:hypothetical protein
LYKKTKGKYVNFHLPVGLLSTFVPQKNNMIRSSLASIFIFLLFISTPQRSLAWGMQGHRIVGQIADSYINAKARAEIRKILGDETIAMASNWPDFIKSDTSFRYLNAWHYADFPKGLNYQQLKDFLKKDNEVDAYTKLNFLISELKKKNLPADTKKMYLKLLIHIAGDVHQPLHVSPIGTQGGNDVKLVWFNQPTNLHSVWDEALINYQQLSYTEYTNWINHPTAKQRHEWQNDPMSKWFYESYTLSTELHDQIKEPNQKLSYVYNFQHIAQVNQQLLKAGVRLAGLLNDIFG